MRVIRSAMMLSLMASASPLAAQSTLTDRPGSWVPVQPASQPQGQVLSAPQAAPVLNAEPWDGVLLEVREGEQTAILSYPSGDGPVLEVPEEEAEGPAPRPAPRPTDLPVPDAVAEVEADPAPEVPEIAPVEIVTTYTGPRPSHRPREVTDLAGAQEVAAVAPVAEVPVAEEAVADDPLLAAAQVEANTLPQAAPERAPTPTAVQAVARMMPGNQPTALSSVVLPTPVSRARLAVQPAAFAVPRADPAPVLSRPLPVGPTLSEGVTALSPVQFPSLSAVLLPGASMAPGRAIEPGAAAEPYLDRFPMSALPPGVLPGGPESQSFARPLSSPAYVSMAAVLIGEHPPAPVRVAAIALPDIPRAGEPPRDPEAGPVLPEADAVVLARVISEAEICWQFAELHGDAAWASLSVEVALDEMNMPTLESVRLTGFAHAMSSSAAEAFQAARGALAACAEATTAEPATAAATIVFDREGVRLR